MTCKEKLAIEHPECFNPNLWAGVDTCPTVFGYHDKPDYCNDKSLSCDERCTMCWNREIPDPMNNEEKKMTCKEKLTIEHPDKLNPNDIGGAQGCPSHYGYLEDPDDSMCRTTSCAECWEREIPEKKPVFEHSGEPISKVKDIFEENGGVVVMLDPVSEHAKKLFEEPRILDSGDRTQFESGAVRDMREGKGRCDLMPLEVVAEFLILFHSQQAAAPINHIAWFQKSGDTEELYRSMYTFCMNAGYNLSHPTMLLEVAKHFEEGAKKYGENNWQKGIPVHCYIDSAVRHYLKWLRGDKDEYHDRAFCWNLMCCIWEVDYREKD